MSSGVESDKRVGVLDLGKGSIEEALAVFEAVINRAKEPDYPLVILHSNKHKAVSLGCFQVRDEDFLMAYLRGKGLRYFFRLHGGDVMLHDENQIGIGLIIPKDGKYDDMHRSLIGYLLRRRGVTNFQVTDDYVLWSNKVLGDVINIEKEKLNSWFTIIYLKRDYEGIARLKFSKEELVRERISKLMDSCIGLNQVLKRDVSWSSLLESAKAVLSNDLNFKMGNLRLGLGDKKAFTKAKKLFHENNISETVQDKYYSLSKDSKVKVFSKRLINGLLRVLLKTRDGAIEKVCFSGSFLFEPPTKLPDFEKMLEDKELDENVLTEKVTEFFINEKIRASFAAFDVVELMLRTASGTNE
ncbi:MAG: lipoyl protein ligase domain-containing protein [Thermoproteota archaeon]